VIGIFVVSLPAAGQAPDEAVFQRLTKVDLEKEVKIELDKSIKDAGIEFSEWRWLDKKSSAIVAKVKPTKGPLGSKSIGFTYYNAKDVKLGGGSFPSQELKMNETGLADIGLSAISEKAARVVIFIGDKKDK